MRACPYPDYGILRGIVDTISPNAVKSTSNNNADLYQVAIEPKDNYVGTASSCKLKSGMTGSVDIITEKETVFKFMIRKTRLRIGM